MVVNLGPVFPTLAEPEDVSTGSGLTYNPRCLKRDISSFVSSQWSRDIDSYNLIIANGSNVYWFQTVMQGNFFIDGFYGVHTAGHFTYGNGDPGGDLFSSPGDPNFWLHHAQIDRTYWIWQVSGSSIPHLICRLSAYTPLPSVKLKSDESLTNADLQNQDLAARTYDYSGTITLNNNPPSRNGTLDDVIDLGVNAPVSAVRDLMSTTAGSPFCYIYI